MIFRLFDVSAGQDAANSLIPVLSFAGQEKNRAIFHPFKKFLVLVANSLHFLEKLIKHGPHEMKIRLPKSSPYVKDHPLRDAIPG